MTFIKTIQIGAWRLIILPPFVLIGLVLGTIVAVMDPLLKRSKRLSKIRVNTIAQLIIGDAWAFTIEQSLRDQVTARIKHTLEWTRGRSETQVVAAHSQGAAIARLVLSRSSLANGLITLGSGSDQLFLVRHFSRNIFSIVYGWLMFLTFIPFSMWIVQDFIAFNYYARQATLSSGSVDWGLVGQAFLRPTLFIMLGVGLVYRFVNNRLLGSEKSPIPRIGKGRWKAIVSPYDLVCTGGAIGSFEGAAVVQVVNYTKLRQILSEHTRYYKNPTTPLSIVDMLESVSKRRIRVDIEDPPTEPDSHRVLEQFWWWGFLITVPAVLLVYHVWNLVWDNLFN